MTTANGLVLLAIGIAFGSLVLAAAIRPTLLTVFWKVTRLVCLLGWVYFGASMIASAVAVLLGRQNLYDFSGGQDYWPLSQSVLWVAIVCGLISLLGRFVAGKDAVPWFFDSDVDYSVFFVASFGLIWFSFFLTQIGIDFFGVSNAGFGNGLIERIVIYGVIVVPLAGALVLTVFALRARRKALK